MHRRHILILLSFLCYHSWVVGQEVKTILSAPDNWNSEQIAFPLGFAPEIDFKGFEDIRFAPGWADKNSEQFWTYHFTWFIQNRGALTEEVLTETMNGYFDGLTRAVLKQQSDETDPETLGKALCLFIKTEDGFRGKMRVFDAFFSKEYITLNVTIKEWFCEGSNKQIVSFNISPQPLDHEVWEVFQNVKVVWECK
ncbi:MAG: hypothetical protein AAGF77_12360 [Bacteroidota bacterium]